MTSCHQFDEAFEGLRASKVYNSIIRDAFPDLPAWIIPYNVVDFTLLQRAAELLRLPREGDLVDLACGFGGPGLWIAEQAACTLTGIDFSAAAIVGAKALAVERRATNCTQFLCAEAARTTLPGEAFDGVVSFDAIQFIGVRALLNEAARILKEGRRFVATMPITIEGAAHAKLQQKEFTAHARRAGLRVLCYAPVETFEDAKERFYTAILKRGDKLAAEIGPAAGPLIEEAREGIECSTSLSLQQVIIVATKGS